MPCCSSTAAWVDQSLQAMQWVRLVVGAGMLVYFDAKSPSWLV